MMDSPIAARSVRGSTDRKSVVERTEVEARRPRHIENTWARTRRASLSSFFFFKQKTAYDIGQFRRVLFRSVRWPRRSWEPSPFPGCKTEKAARRSRRLLVRSWYRQVPAG